MLTGRRQLPLFSKQVVAYVKSGQSKVSLGSFNLMTNMPWHKPTDSISVVASRKMSSVPFGRAVAVVPELREPGTETQKREFNMLSKSY